MKKDSQSLTEERLTTNLLEKKKTGLLIREARTAKNYTHNKKQKETNSMKQLTTDIHCCILFATYLRRRSMGVYKTNIYIFLCAKEKLNENYIKQFVNGSNL